MKFMQLQQGTTEGRPQSGVTRLPGSVLLRKCACGQHTMNGNCDDCAKKKGSTGGVRTSKQVK